MVKWSGGTVFGSADSRWETTAKRRDEAVRQSAALAQGGSPAFADEARCRALACELFLVARDPLRAAAEWARLPEQAFSQALGAPPALRIKPLYGALVDGFALAFRTVIGSSLTPLSELGPDQARALLDAYPGVPELWWALSRRARNAVESELARTRALRLDPAFADESVAEAAWRDIDSAIAVRIRVTLQPERPCSALPLAACARVLSSFADLVADYTEKTAETPATLRLSSSPPACDADSGALAFEALADGLHPFALESLNADLESPLARAGARLRLALLSLLQEHRLRLSVSLAAQPFQPGLFVGESRRKGLLEMATQAARRTLDSRDIPQADDLERVFHTVETIASLGTDPPDISARQASHHRRAAKTLGLLTEAGEITAAGRLIARLDPEARLRAAAVHFESSACGDAWLAWSKARTLCEIDPETAADFLQTSAPGLSKDTTERRAQCLQSWHRALASHHYARPPEIRS